MERGQEEISSPARSAANAHKVDFFPSDLAAQRTAVLFSAVQAPPDHRLFLPFFPAACTSHLFHESALRFSNYPYRMSF
jgi:hypothetical protein